MYRDWRNRKFVEKIDKLYFHKDKQGNRFMKGTLLVVYDNKTGAYGNVMALRVFTTDYYSIFYR